MNTDTDTHTHSGINDFILWGRGLILNWSQTRERPVSSLFNLCFPLNQTKKVQIMYING